MADWRLLKNLPVVSPFRRGRRNYTWENRRDDYAALEKTPLIISAELVTPIIYAEENSVNFDSILSYAAVTTHPCPSSFVNNAVIPIALELLWVSKNGLPLWACSRMIPVSEFYNTREYWHKRYPTHRAEFGNKMNAVTSAGRYREYRVPVHVQYVKKISALVIGNRDEIENQLEFVTHVGKKGSIGYGRVSKWSVEPGDHTVDDIISARPVPVAYPEAGKIDGILSHNVGWTPPYWYAPWWDNCVIPK